MQTKRLALSLVMVVFVLGCANTTAVLPANTSTSEFDGAVYSGETVELEKATPDAEVFRVFQQGATGFVSVASVRGGVEEIATRFCDRKGKSIKPIQETASKPPHVLGNFPRVEWLFQCVDGNPKKADAASAGGKYVLLERLKKLLDNGTLTQHEFEIEKSKILAKP